MKRDWFWGIAAGAVAFFGALIGFGRILPGPTMDRIGLALATGALVIASIGGLWLGNLHSIRGIRRAGGEARMIVRPVEAVVRFLWLFVLFSILIYGLATLAGLLFDYRASATAPPRWFHAAMWALCHSLMCTTYYAPKPEMAAA